MGGKNNRCTCSKFGFLIVSMLFFTASEACYGNFVVRASITFTLMLGPSIGVSVGQMGFNERFEAGGEIALFCDYVKGGWGPYIGAYSRYRMFPSREKIPFVNLRIGNVLSGKMQSIIGVWLGLEETLVDSTGTADISAGLEFQYWFFEAMDGEKKRSLFPFPFVKIDTKIFEE